MRPETEVSQRILIVEDDLTTADTYARMLRLEGYEPMIALCAKDGLTAVEHETPDAIILDVRMPVVDGVEVLRTLRARHETSETPVAIVTGDYFLDDTIKDQLNALHAAIHFKPLWLEDLTALVRDLLEQKH